MQRDIHIEVSYCGKTYTLETYAFEYRSLMALLYDKIYIEDFGECKGIGRCGTCHVHLPNASDALLQRQGNELTTLGKMSNVAGNSRLSCHIPVTSLLHGMQIAIVGDDEPAAY